MSILSDLLNKKITFQQAVTEATSWATTLTSHDATLTADVGTALSGVKQAASDAITLGDTLVGQAIGPATVATETALDAALAGLTKGASVPFNPFVNDGIDAMANAVKNAADAWALQAKASLVPKP
jgi:hypothetical protein